jgi:hypothetical protein
VAGVTRHQVGERQHLGSLADGGEWLLAAPVLVLGLKEIDAPWLRLHTG